WPGEFASSTTPASVLDFSRDNVRKSVGLHHLELLDSNDELRVRATGNDAFILLGASGNTSEVESLEVRFRIRGSLSAEQVAVLYWQPEESNITAANRAAVPYETGNDWIVITFPLSKIPEWNTTGRFVALRLDFQNPSSQ